MPERCPPGASRHCTDCARVGATALFKVLLPGVHSSIHPSMPCPCPFLATVLILKLCQPCVTLRHTKHTLVATCSHSGGTPAA